MRRSLTHCLLFALIFMLGAGSSLAAGRGEQLFELTAGDLPAFRGAEAAWRVHLDSDLLAEAPRRLVLETPDGLEFDARQIGFERRGPGSLTWRGRLADSRDSRAIFSMEDGAVSGWIHTPFGEYEVWPLADGGSAVLRMSNEPLGACGAGQPAFAVPPTAGDETTYRPADPGVARDIAGSIDVLALFTIEARDIIGGPAPMKSRIRLMFDIANETFANSRMAARLNPAYIGPSPLRETGKMDDNLVALRVHPGVRALRETHSADLVALFQTSDPLSCGIAYVMSEVSPDFAPWAYSVTSFRCLSTFAHEVGHNMGMQHDPANGDTPGNAIFPWAFGHFVKNNWRTTMSYPNPCGSCSRAPHFSNPNVLYEGQPTGIAGERDNARVGNRTANTIANFFLSGVVLADGFETGEPSGWSKDRGGLMVVEPGLVGNYALEIPMTGTSSRKFLAHRLGGMGRSLDVSFVLNADSVELNGAEVDILVLFGNGTAHTKLALLQEGSRHVVRLLTRGDQGGYVEVARTPVRSTRNETIAIEFRSAGDAKVADGFLRLIKNGGSRGVLRDFANNRWVAREVRLGLPNGAAGTSATARDERVLVDDYSATLPTEPQ